MAKLLIFNFDGTDNEPADAIQDKNFFGSIEDSSITNVLKIHLLLGGTLQNKTGNTQLKKGTRTFYYNGVGTYGNFFERKYNAGLAKESADVSTILRLARKDFRDHYVQEDIDYIVVVGFSRGAALARRFASIISDEVTANIIVEAVFDTVASIGLPNLSSRERPTTEVVFEHGHTLPRSVKAALHLVSIDDKRRAFQPTLMNRDERVTEIWFAGVHSDVGGGYHFDGLSDNSLRFCLDWLEDQTYLGLKFGSSKSIDYENIFGPDEKLRIGPDDVQIDANPFGVNHQQDRNPLVEALTLTDRRCCVIEHDEVSSLLPMVHCSVAEKIQGDGDYRPKSLRNARHEVVYRDGVVKEYLGYSEHKIKSSSRFVVPDEGGAETRIYAHLKYNHTGIYLEAGQSYIFEVINKAKQKWRDGSVQAVDGAGWDRGDVKLGPTEIVIAVAEPFRRVTTAKAKWFTLCGCIGDDDSKAFVIGNKLECHTVDQSGEFCAFANDLDGYYGNNSGYLLLKIRKLHK
ncbi:MAG: hypothetical protein ACJAYE_001701 [Candidatus Azotimanducaceae bacterium]|jgi:hypothetical protein